MPRWMMATASDVFIHYPLWMMSRIRQTTEFHFILLQDRGFGHTEGTNMSRAHNMSGLVARELSGSYVHLSRRWTCDGRSCCRRFGRCDSRGFTEEGSKGGLPRRRRPGSWGFPTERSAAMWNGMTTGGGRPLWVTGLPRARP